TAAPTNSPPHPPPGATVDVPWSVVRGPLPLLPRKTAPFPLPTLPATGGGPRTTDGGMKHPWQSYLQLGVVHFTAFPECLAGEGPQLETRAAICHDPFFDGVDVGPINDAAQRRECAALLRDCQMSVGFACQPLQLRLGLDLNARDEAARRRAAD